MGNNESISSSEERLTARPAASSPAAAANPRTPRGTTSRSSQPQMQSSGRQADAPPAYDDIFGNSAGPAAPGPSTSHGSGNTRHSSSLKQPSRKSSSRGPSPCPDPHPPMFDSPSAPPPPSFSRSLDTDYHSDAPNSFAPPSVAPNWDEEEEERELRMWFAAVDESGCSDGHITANELQQALLNDNYTPFNMDTISMMLRMFDKNLNDRIEYREFAGLKRYVQDWKKMFDRFDSDHSGTIDVQEIQQAFEGMGYTFTPKFCSSLCQRFSPKNGARIGLDAFIYACAMVKALSLDHQKNPRNLSLESFLTRWLEGSK